MTISTAKGWVLTIFWLESVDSTQYYLRDALKNRELSAPVAVVAEQQNSGRGSRGNSWEGIEGNLFFSFAFESDALPSDLKLESSSIYFTYLLKEVLAEAGSKLWLKWPNDLYLDDKKIGGTITNLEGTTLVCGIGLNIKAAPEGFGRLDIDISKNELLQSYFRLLEKMIPWKQIFRKFKLEFERCRTKTSTVQNRKISLKEAKLLEDGSLELNGQRIYSLR